MIVKLLFERHLEFLSYTHVKISNCWKSHAAAHYCYSSLQIAILNNHSS